MTEPTASSVLECRARLIPRLREHAERLATSLDPIEPGHRDAGSILADWIASGRRLGEPARVVVVCTGNSRRSILGSAMGNLAAAYHGLPDLRFHSGGTSPTAFNRRTASTLMEIGFEVAPTGPEAPRGDPETANPIYRITWGDGFEMLEFSKHYADASNPQADFAALMVCDEADSACPTVKGAALRISLPYLDPKYFDGQPCEAEAYAERRDEIGRLMFSVMARSQGRMTAP